MTQDQPTTGAVPADPTADRATAPAAEAPAAARPTPRPPRAPGADTGPRTGVDELEGLDDLPVAEHVERFAAVHDALRARLDGAPDAGQDDGPAAGPRR
ncbi:hypothetical protein [Isoptericola sp. NPDC058082]|uniref:hypothetical protein n=1 Tax=Isoptericola sp. NPDC058082 TaxID=3346331 RepID=UPI0036E53AB7